jgi:hypothetical protein
MLETTDAIILVVALVATWAMAGVIWVIQIVHYPLFDTVERAPTTSSGEASATATGA